MSDSRNWERSGVERPAEVAGTLLGGGIDIRPFVGLVTVGLETGVEVVIFSIPLMLSRKMGTDEERLWYARDSEERIVILEE